MRPQSLRLDAPFVISRSRNEIGAKREGMCAAENRREV